MFRDILFLYLAFTISLGHAKIAVALLEVKNYCYIALMDNP